MDFHMQLVEFICLLEKQGLSYAIYGICFPSPKSGISYVICGIYFPSPKTWAIIYNIRNFWPFSKNVDYQMQFLKFLSILKKYGLSYAFSEKKFYYPKTWTTICNF